MSKPQTVRDLLNQFHLKLDLPKNILEMNLNGEFDSIELKKDHLFAYNGKDITKEYEYYQFKGNGCMCNIIPDRVNGVISIYKILGETPRAIGKTYDIKGNIVAKS